MGECCTMQLIQKLYVMDEIDLRYHGCSFYFSICFVSIVWCFDIEVPHTRKRNALQKDAIMSHSGRVCAFHTEQRILCVGLRGVRIKCSREGESHCMYICF